jgi:hypothetical protein
MLRSSEKEFKLLAKIVSNTYHQFIHTMLLVVQEKLNKLILMIE